jgi:IS4 transposase
MARKHCIDLRRTFNRLVPRRRLEELAVTTGAVRRVRKIGVVPLFWTLVLGFSTGHRRTLAGMRRAMESSAGVRVAPSAFYDRLTPALVKLLRAVLVELIDKLAGSHGKLSGALAAFRDVLIIDSSVIRLHDLLARRFPACRTNHTLAALKTHVVVSVRGVGARSLKLTSERVHDGPVLRAGRWVRGKLLLFDLGYYRFQLFACIQRQGGYFVTRLKDRANPVIVATHLKWRGRTVTLVGEHLQDVLARLKRRVIDLDVELRFQRRRYGDHRSSATMRVRLVGVLNPDTGRYHLYLTNVPPEKLSAEMIARTYAARWLIELTFRQLKTHFRLDQMPSRKRHVVEALVLSAFITMMLSGALLAQLRRRLGVALRGRLRQERWAAVFVALAQHILMCLLRPRPQITMLLRLVDTTWRHEAIDPNRGRLDLLQRVQQVA